MRIIAFVTEVVVVRDILAHLDLKVTLLTGQKAAKLIDLLEELRRDLPNVRNRHDPEAAAHQGHTETPAPRR